MKLAQIRGKNTRGKRVQFAIIIVCRESFLLKGENIDLSKFKMVCWPKVAISKTRKNPEIKLYKPLTDNRKT